jgi:hypothetical protein
MDMNSAQLAGVDEHTGTAEASVVMSAISEEFRVVPKNWPSYVPVPATPPKSTGDGMVGAHTGKPTSLYGTICKLADFAKCTRPLVRQNHERANQR